MADPTSGTILKSVAIATLTRIIFALSGWAVARGFLAEGLLSSGDITVLALGAFGLLVSLAYVIRAKIRTWYLVEAAKDAPAGEKMSVIRADAVSNSPV